MDLGATDEQLEFTMEHVILLLLALTSRLDPLINPQHVHLST